MKKDRILNLPNLVTMFRVFLVPVLVAILLAPKKFDFDNHVYFKREEIGVLVFSIAAISDWLDGWLARRRGESSVFGQLLDPLADKLLIASALISLVDLQLAETWVVVVIIGRELAVTGLRGMASAMGFNYPAGWIGKWKMGAEIAAIILLILGNLKNSTRAEFAFPIFRFFSVPRGLFLYVSQAGAIILYVAMILALISAMQLFTRFLRDANAVEAP
jgi:CDP-diacylglycerol--glycerol-3-phosphate 3-phosphatidyltransferase